MRREPPPKGGGVPALSCGPTLGPWSVIDGQERRLCRGGGGFARRASAGRRTAERVGMQRSGVAGERMLELLR